MDDQDRLWFAEYQGNAIGMFDPKTDKISEWKVPTPWSAPYDAMAGKNGEAWTGSMLTDRVARLDIKNGQYTEYQLPRPTNIRRVFVDDSKKPGTLWVGNNHTGVATRYDGSGTPQSPVVTIPPPTGGSPPSTPTGVAFNPHSNVPSDSAKSVGIV